MTVVTSSAPIVKKRLLELFAANSVLTGVQVAYAHPSTKIKPESVYFHTTELSEGPASLGPNLAKLEDYTLTVIVDVARNGDDPQGAEERCWELVGGVETVVRENVRVATEAKPSGAITGWLEFDGATVTPSILDGGQRLAEAVVRIKVNQNRKQGL